MAAQQFNLRWNNHTSNILQVFLEHLTSESLVDVTLSCQGRFIRAHKIILSACSPYFQELFAHHVDKHPIIILKGIKYDDLQAMIKFMYNGEIRVQETQLDELLAAAELLQVKGLSNVRSKYERGEITSLQNPTQKAAAPFKMCENIGGRRDSPLPGGNKASLAAFGSNSIATSAQAVVNPAPTVVSRNTPKAGIRAAAATAALRSTSCAAVRLPTAGFHTTAGALNRVSTNATPTIAIATLVPTTVVQNSNVIPVSAMTTALTTISTTSISNTTATNNLVASTTAFGTISNATSNPSALTTNRSTPTVVDTSSASPTVGCPIIIANSVTSVGSDASIAAVIDPTVVELDAETAGTTTTAARSDIKIVEPEIPRVRKRRKMSHTVNELARETVFSSNGVIVLEPDEAVVRNVSKISKTQTSNRVNAPETGKTEESSTTNDSRKLKVKILPKQPQTSLLIKDKDKEAETTKIPRPPNAFMIFANEWRRKLAIEYPKESNTKISVRLGIMWKGLTIQAKEMYYRLAKKADEEHRRKYPSYRYCPKPAKFRTTLKSNSSISKGSREVDALGMVKIYMNSEDGEGDDYTDSDDSQYDDDDDDDNEDDEFDDNFDDYGDDEPRIDSPKNDDGVSEHRHTFEKVKENASADDKSSVTT